MKRLLVVVLFGCMAAPGLAGAAKLKVSFPDEEYACTAMLDTKLMPKADYERVVALFRDYKDYPDVVGFIDSTAKLHKARAKVGNYFAELETQINKINAFKKPEWKALRAHILTTAKRSREKQLAALQFMEDWKPYPMLNPEELVPPEEVGVSLEHECNDRLRALADVTIVQGLSKLVAADRCFRNPSKECRERFLITPETPATRRDEKRREIFQWSWYNNGACQYANAKTAPSNYEGPDLESLLHAGISGVHCEREASANDCG